MRENYRIIFRKNAKRRSKGGEKMETMEYIVDRIDGDYAYLVRVDQPDEEKLVARALLPAEIMEGSCLIYECLEYSIK